MIDSNRAPTSVQTIFRILVISLLNEKPMSGYDLIKSIEELTGDKPSQGKIYPFLHDLLECGQIVERTENSDDGREKKMYSLTPKGMKILDNVFSQLKHFINSCLTVCVNCGCKYLEKRNKKISDKDVGKFYCCEACRRTHN